MGTTRIGLPTSHLRSGAARAALTPPVGVDHRRGGGARHERAGGVHRPVPDEAPTFAPLAGDGPPLTGR
jgi:hypothetical protein